MNIIKRSNTRLEIQALFLILAMLFLGLTGGRVSAQATNAAPTGLVPAMASAATEATPGWLGDLNFDAKDNVWLVVSNGNGISGRLMGTDATPKSDVFRISPTDQDGTYTPLVAYSPDINKFLVVWNSFPNPNGPEGFYSRLVSPDGTLGGVVNLNVDGFLNMGAQKTSSLQYDANNNTFVLAWMPFSGGYINLATIDLTGNRATVIKLPSTGKGDYNPKIAINVGKNEYCVLYDQRSGGPGNTPPSLAVRKITASNLALGSETTAVMTTTSADIAYDSASGKYLAIYNDGSGGISGKILNSCNINDTSASDVSILTNETKGRVAVNATSNTFAIIGQDTDDSGSTWAVIDSAGANLSTGTVLVPSVNGQFVQMIAPNTADGTFAAITDHDYASTVLVTNIGFTGTDSTGITSGTGSLIGSGNNTPATSSCDPTSTDPSMIALCDFQNLENPTVPLPAPGTSPANPIQLNASGTNGVAGAYAASSNEILVASGDMVSTAVSPQSSVIHNISATNLPSVLSPPRGLTKLAYDSVDQVYLAVDGNTGWFLDKAGNPIGSPFVFTPESPTGREPDLYIAWTNVAFGGPANDPAFLVTYIASPDGVYAPKYARLIRYKVGGQPTVSNRTYVTNVTGAWNTSEKSESVWNGTAFIIGTPVIANGMRQPQVNLYNMANESVSGAQTLGDGQDYEDPKGLACAPNGTCLSVGFANGTPFGGPGGTYARLFNGATLAPIGNLFYLDNHAARNDDEDVVFDAHIGKFVAAWDQGGQIVFRLVNTDGTMGPLDPSKNFATEATDLKLSYNAGTQTTLLVTKMDSGAELRAVELGDDGYPIDPNKNILISSWDGRILLYAPTIGADSADSQWLVLYELGDGTHSALIQGTAGSVLTGSVGDTRITGEMLDAKTMNVLSGPFQIDSAPKAKFKGYPQVAFSPDAKQFLVAWQDERLAAGASNIFGRFLDDKGTVVGNDFPIVADRNVTLQNMEYDPVAKNFVLDYENSGGIFYKTVTGVGQVGAEVSLPRDASSEYEGQSNLTVNSTLNQNWISFVVCTSKGTANEDCKITLDRVSQSTGTVTGQSIILNTDRVGQNLFATPSIAYDAADHEALAVWQENGRPEGTGIFGKTIKDDGTVSEEDPIITSRAEPFSSSYTDPSNNYNSWTNSFFVTATTASGGATTMEVDPDGSVLQTAPAFALAQPLKSWLDHLAEIFITPVFASGGGSNFTNIVEPTGTLNAGTQNNAVVLTTTPSLASPPLPVTQYGAPNPLNPPDLTALPKLINQIYVWALGLGSLLALLMMIAGGYYIMTSSGNAETASRGKEMITGAVIGLILLFGSYLILQTINPALVNFNIGSVTGLTPTPGQPVATAPSTPGTLVSPSAPAPTTPSSPATPTTPTPAVPGTPLPSPVNGAYSDANARTVLLADNIKPNAVQPQTSLNGMKTATVNEVLGVKNAACGSDPNCSVTVTGGTEPGHADTGTCNHSSGNKVDLQGTTPALTNYITTNFTRSGTRASDGAPLYTDPATGALYAQESTHWDIAVGC